MERQSLHIFFASLLRCINQFTSVSGWVYVFGSALLAISRFIKLLAFFLPLKIFLVIHANEVPQYLNTFFPELEFDSFISTLLLFVPALYICFFICSVFHTRLVDMHLELFQTKELVLWGDEVPKKTMEKLHKHSVKAFSDLGLIGVSLVLLAIVDYPISVISVAVLIFTFVFFHRLGIFSEGEKRVTFAKIPAKQFTELVTSVSFLFLFVVIVFRLLFFDVGIYSSIFVLLVGRLACQALHRFAIECIYITKFLK